MYTKKVKISELKEGPIMHEMLPEAFITRIKRYKQILSEVEPTSLEKTLDAFQRDWLPEREIITWEHIAHRYKLITQELPNLTIEEKKKLFGALLKATMTLPT